MRDNEIHNTINALVDTDSARLATFTNPARDRGLRTRPIEDPLPRRSKP